MYLRLHDQNPFFRNFDQFFNEGTLDKNSGFPVNFREEAHHYIFEAQIPKVKKENIHIDYKNRLLTVSYEVQEEKNEKEKSEYLLQEIYEGKFSRSIRVPSEVNSDKIEAKLEDGILKIVLPKKDEDIQKRIAVH